MVGYWKIIVKGKFAIYGFLIMAFGLLIYLPALSAGFVLDDEGQIVHNQIIHSLSNFPLFFKGGTFYGGDNTQLIGGFYRPVMSIAYAAIYSLAGLNPMPYHLFSVLVHAINGILTFLFLRWLLRKQGDTLPFLLALLFVAHPMLVSGVAYIAAVNEPLFYLFGMSSLLVLMYRPFSLVSLGTSLALVFMGLLSKETTILFIALGGLYLYLFNNKKVAAFAAGSIVVMCIYLYMRCGIAHMCDGRTGIGPLALMPFDRYLMQLPAIAFFYLYTFVLPARLAISQEWIIHEPSLSSVYLPALAVAAFAFACLIFLFSFYYTATNRALMKKNEPDRVPKTYVIALMMFVLGMIMHLHIIPLDFTVDEHWFYFSLAGLTGMIGIIIAEFSRDRARNIVYVVLATAVLFLGYRTYLRCFDWRDNITLFSRDIRYSTDSAALTNNLATEYFRKGRYKESETYFTRSTRIDPERPVAWTNLGIIAELRKDYAKAGTYYQTAISKGRYYKAYELYASLLLKQGKKREAARFLKSTAMPLFPHNSFLKQLYRSATSS